MNRVINVKNLNKRYGNIQALDGANLQVYEGTIHGLFGANGAGKSTMIRILMGVTSPDMGYIDVKGHDVMMAPDNARAICTPVVEIPFLYKDMRLYDMLKFFCELNGSRGVEVNQRIEEALYLTGTGDILEKRYGKMSLGQQHRSEVARAIATANEILLMDEPFIGIDVDTKRKLKVHFKKWVKEEQGRAIVFTSHNLMENEGFVDKLTFLKAGKTVETGSIDQFKSRHLKPTYVFTLDNIELSRSIITEVEYARFDRTHENKIWVSLESEENVKSLVKELAMKDVGITGLERAGSVEDVFSKIVEVVN